jgi:hypothetical protein
MSMRPAGWRTVLLAPALAVIVLLGACGSHTASSGGATAAPSPSGGPDITGIVWRVTPGPGGTGSLEVVGLQGGPGSYDRASVTLTDQTSWRLVGGSSTPPPLDRLEGRRVAITFTGPVAESYPVQATAGGVHVLEGLDSFMDVTLAGAPQLRGRAVAMVRNGAGTVVTLEVRRGGAQAELVAVPVTDRTSWVLDSRNEFRPVNGVPLIGNGLQSHVDVRLSRGAAEWVVLRLPH